MAYPSERMVNTAIFVIRALNKNAVEIADAHDIKFERFGDSDFEDSSNYVDLDSSELLIKAKRKEYAVS